MKKAESESAIRHLVGVWARRNGFQRSAEENPSFFDFWAWLRENYSGYLSFRTTTSVEFDVEMWFDEEMKQTWRR